MFKSLKNEMEWVFAGKLFQSRCFEHEADSTEAEKESCTVAYSMF